MKAQTYRYCMFDDLAEHNSRTGSGPQNFPRDLEGMSVNELEHYITELQNEIARVQTDIAAKKASEEAAAAVFKS